MSLDKFVYNELLLGCGHAQGKRFGVLGKEGWHTLTTVDINPNCNPDVVWDLNDLPLPFEDETFDEIHAYEVLEHCGHQGDYKYFFAQFEDFWRMLKPNGLFFATVPAFGSPWVWADPSHTRAIPEESLIYLSQATYRKNIGTTCISDFRHIYKADFEEMAHETVEDQFRFVLRAIK